MIIMMIMIILVMMIIIIMMIMIMITIIHNTDNNSSNNDGGLSSRTPSLATCQSPTDYAAVVTKPTANLSWPFMGFACMATLLVLGSGISKV